MSYNWIVLLVGLLAPSCELRHLSLLEEALLPRRCTHPPKQGKCNQALLRYYFDVQTKTCRSFFYKGCEVSSNNFVTLKDCIHECHVFIQMAQMYRQPVRVPKICTFPKEEGLCKAAFPRYYYNTETKMCEKFIYGGCGGNANNFENNEDCIEKCQRFSESTGKFW